MKIEKIIPLILLIGISCITGYIGWRYLGNKYDLYDGGFVIGFLLPTLIIYWCSKIKVKDEHKQEDEGRKDKCK